MFMKPLSPDNLFVSIYKEAHWFLAQEDAESKLHGAVTLKWLHQQGAELLKLYGVDQKSVQIVMDKLRTEIQEL